MFAKISSYLTAVMAIAMVVAGEEASDNREDRRGRGMMFGWNMMEGGKRSCAGLHGRPGVCMGQNECAEMRGKTVGRCFPFDSCCSITPNSCGAYSGLSTSYFQSPDKFQEMCTYKVNVRRNVCQIRIDFEKFTLDQPSKPYNGLAYSCERDEFAVFSNDNTKIINTPVLCGENSGQHVYVPVKEQMSSDLNNRQQVTLKFRLTARNDDYTAPEPLWKIKITQLECPATPINWWKIKDIARQIWDREVEEDREEEEKEEKEKDASASKPTRYSLAPDGCLQYFTDKEGSFESFNYNKGAGHYLGNLNYAVCFKRNQDTCGIKYEAVKFQIAYNQKRSNSTDRDCDTIDESTTTAPASPLSPQPEIDTQTTQKALESLRMVKRKKLSGTVSDLHSDYLLIPDGLYSERYFASKYCDQSLENMDDITVKTHGPLYVAFVSDGYSNPNEDMEKGYKINYSLLNSGC